MGFSMQNHAEPPGRGLGGRNLRRCSASERGLRITDCRWITRSTGLPDYGLFWDPRRCVSGQPWP
eukprot:6092196-Alexandrium_andersonii.AAC.1